MTIQTKDRMWTIGGSAFVSLLVLFVGLGVSSSTEANKGRDSRIDAKVERKEFDKYTKDTKEVMDKKVDCTVFEKYEQETNTRFQESEQRTQDNLKEIKGEIQGMRSDARIDAAELQKQIIQILKDQKK